MLCTSLLGFFISLLASTVLAEDYRQTVYPEISPANTCAKWKTACKDAIRYNEQKTDGLSQVCEVDLVDQTVMAFCRTAAGQDYTYPASMRADATTVPPVYRVFVVDNVKTASTSCDSSSETCFESVKGYCEAYVSKCFERCAWITPNKDKGSLFVEKSCSTFTNLGKEFAQGNCQCVVGPDSVTQLSKFIGGIIGGSFVS